MKINDYNKLANSLNPMLENFNQLKIMINKSNSAAQIASQLGQITNTMALQLPIFTSPFVNSVPALDNPINRVAQMASANVNAAQRIWENLTPAIVDLQNYIRINASSLDFSGMANALSSINYDITEEEIEEYKNDPEICDIINEAVENKPNWQQIIVAKIEELKKSKPVIACVLIFILLHIFSGAFNRIGEVWVDKLFLKEEPNSKSQTLQIINKNQEVTILSDAPYYYEIEITEEQGTTTSGWASKRSIKLKPLQDETIE
ncbi:MAG: SH3 domain-containing protein [Clostridiales bacterium]|jgi:hypothetical protein|nr:SH3 domain-containing protein [Clostridiales bacterium]